MNVKLKNKMKIIAGILLVLFYGCASSPRFTTDRTRFEKKSPSRFDNSAEYDDADALETVTGTASYYADKYNGLITYNGEVYDMYGLSAAHPVYQMGTVVRVTNLSNGKRVTIKINDRMPFRPDRIIDLSLGCAMELDMVNAGITEVKVEVLEWGKGKK
jgi:rare lipoprotein A